MIITFSGKREFTIRLTDAERGHVATKFNTETQISILVQF